MSTTAIMTGKTAIFSISHISEKTSKWMSAQARADLAEPYGNDLSFSIYEGHYGFVVSIPKTHELLEVPSDLRFLMKMVQRTGFAFLVLDRDAEPYPAIPIFEW